MQHQHHRGVALAFVQVMHAHLVAFAVVDLGVVGRPRIAGQVLETGVRGAQIVHGAARVEKGGIYRKSGLSMAQ